MRRIRVGTGQSSHVIIRNYLNGQALQILFARAVADQERGPADILLDFALRSKPPITFLAVCPNSVAVAKAALVVASRLQFPLFFAATLNQIDGAEGYTSWTPDTFARWVEKQSAKMPDAPLVIIGLDHGGPWKKDVDYQRKLRPQEAMTKVEESIESCLRAGYGLLHIDATADPFQPGSAVPVKTIVERTVQLIRYAEDVRRRLDLPPVSYEVGTEEVSGGLTTLDRFREFVGDLYLAFQSGGLSDKWPCFFVGDVGTNLDTIHFDEELAASLSAVVKPYGSMLKGHYTDFVDTPDRYPAAGMGGANIGPEFSAVEFQAVMQLADTQLADKPLADKPRPGATTSERPSARQEVERAIREALVDTGRWRKWLRDDEVGLPFESLDTDRQQWLLGTGSRYVWAEGRVEMARNRLYARLGVEVDGPLFVQNRIEASIEKYAVAFGLSGLNARLGEFLAEDG